MTHEDDSEAQSGPGEAISSVGTPRLPGIGDELQRTIRAYKRAASLLRDIFEGPSEEFALKDRKSVV